MSHPSHRFDAATDPTVAKLTRQINRSAGQHKRAISEGTASAQAILRSVPMTADPLKLDDGIPVLRMVHSRHERQVVEPVPFSKLPAQQQAKAWNQSQRAERPADEPSPLEQGGSGSGIAAAIVVTIIAAVSAWSVLSSTGGADDALRVLSAAFR